MSKNYRHAKVVPSKGLKVIHVAAILAIAVIGVGSAKALTSSDAQSSDTVIVSEQVSSNNDCSALISGHACRIDAAIEAATAQ